MHLKTALFSAAAVLLLGCMQAQPGPEHHIARAGQLQDEGKFRLSLEAAEQACTGLEQSGSENKEAKVRAFLLRGRALQALAYTDSALVFLEHAFKMADPPLRYEALLHHSNAFAAKSRFKEALEGFEEVMTFVSAHESAFDKTFPAEIALAYGVWHLRQGNWDAAMGKYREALRLLPSPAVNSGRIAGQCRNYWGYALWKDGKLASAIEQFLQAEQLFIEGGGAGNNYLAGMYVNMGACYAEIGEPLKAVKCYESAHPIFNDQRTDHPNIVSVYNNLGNAYNNLGESTLAVRYLQKTVEIQPTNPRYWNNLGDALLNMDDWAEAEKALNRSLDLFLSKNSLSPSDSSEIARPYHNLSLIARSRGDAREALRLGLKSIPFRKSNGPNTLDVARSWLGVGQSYYELSDYRQATAALDSALIIHRSVLPGGVYSEMSAALLYKARCAAGSGNYQSYEMLLDSALLACGYRPQMPAASDHPMELLAILEERGRHSLDQFEKNRETDFLTQAEKTYAEAREVVGQVRRRLGEGRSKSLFAERQKALFEGSIRADLFRHGAGAGGRFPPNAFAATEQSKSLLLLEGIREADAAMVTGIPERDVEAEKKLRQEIAKLETVVKRLIEKEGTSEFEIREKKNLLFDVQQQHERLQKNLAQQYPAYHNYIFGAAIATVPEVQKDVLQPGQTLLEYFIGDTHIYIFVIDRQRYHIHEVKKDFPLDSLVQQLRYGLYGYYSKERKTEMLRQKTLDVYVSAAQELYHRLVTPVESYLGESLIVIPDGAISYIPFEALLKAPPGDPANFQTWPFMLRDRTLSYAYSATLLREMQDKRHERAPGNTLLALAPFYPGDYEAAKKDFDSRTGSMDELVLRGKFAPLNNTGRETYLAQQVWKGQYKLNADASKTFFQKECGKYRILHLATHGVADNRQGDFSYLAFSPLPGSDEHELLYVRELYNLHLNADLVILSACETGTGELQRGEGVISLARAFAHSGAKSIMTTLWVANDFAVAEITGKMHVALHNGLRKDEALRNAKLEYLRKHPDKNAHPFYWAGMIAVGDMTPLR